MNGCDIPIQLLHFPKLWEVISVIHIPSKPLMSPSQGQGWSQGLEIPLGVGSAMESMTHV